MASRSHHSALPCEVWERLEGILERFEDAWKRGQRPAIDDYLAQIDGERRALLIELVHEDLAYRLQAGESARVENYLERYPLLRTDPAVLLDLIAAEYLLRQDRRDAVDIAEYTARFPELAADLARRLAQCQSGVNGEGIASAEAPTLPPPAPPAADPTGARARAPSTVAAPASLLPTPGGADVPDYEVLGVLGQGGMGVVYKARQLSLGRVVALKMILHAGHAGDDERRRFQIEAESVARLQHPHIVQVYEVGEHQGCPYLSLEYCGGGTLEQRLDGTPWEGQRAAQLIETLARAVQAAHAAGVVHRDLKPANVLLTADGLPKVADFGLAKRLGERGKTQTGAIVGTPSYMAPEQAGGKGQEVGPAADVYALGAILYELLTGRPPFKAALPLDTVMQVVQDEPISVRRLQPKASRDLETICHRCLEKQPGRRYASAEALAEDLRRFQAGEPIAARPVGRLERGVKWARRRPALAALVVVVLLAGAALLGSGLWFAARLAKERERVEDVGRKVDNALEAALREKAEAERQHKRAEWLVYAGQLALAHHEWQDNNVAHARDLLAMCRPEFRHWEHGYLRHLCDGNQQTLRGHGRAVASVCYSPDGKTLASASYDSTVKLWDTATGKERRTLPHDSAVVAVCFGPAGKHLATATFGGRVILWEAATGREIARLATNNSRVYAVAFRPDGKNLAAGGDGKTVTVWDTATLKEIGRLGGLPGVIRAVCYSPDGKRLATASEDSSVRVWDAATGAKLWEAETGRNRTSGSVCICFSPEGKRLAGTHSDRAVKVWDAATGKEQAALQGRADVIQGLAFSPDGRRLASGSKDQTVRVWDPTIGKELFTLRGHTDSVTCLGYSPDGQSLASGSDDATVKLWDARVAQESLDLTGHADSLRAVTFSPDGKWLASASWDDTLKLWDPATGMELRTLVEQSDPVSTLACSPALHAVAFSPDGKWLAGPAPGRKLTVWELTGKKPLWALENASDVRAVTFSPDGKRFACCGWLGRQVSEDSTEGNYRVKVCEAATGKEVAGFREPAVQVNALCFSPDSKRLAGASTDHTVKVWDAATGKELFALQGHGLGVLALAFSPDGQWLATASQDKTVGVWDVQTRKRTLHLEGHAEPVRALCFSPDGRRLASGGLDRTIREWDAETGAALLTRRGHAAAVVALRFRPDGRLTAALADHSVKVWEGETDRGTCHPEGYGETVRALGLSPDGQRLASAAQDNVQVWDLATGRELFTQEGGVTGVNRWTEIHALSFSPDGRRLAGRKDNTVRVWETASGKQVLRLAGHLDDVSQVCFNPDGTLLATASLDHTVKLWDAATGRERRTIEGQKSSPLAVCFSPDGARLATASDDDTVRIWDVASVQKRPLREFPGGRTAVCFSPDGKRLATATWGVVKVWDCATWTEVVNLTGHTGGVMALHFGRDGRRLFSFATDRTVKVWDAATGLELLTLRSRTGSPNDGGVSSDRLRLASTDGSMVRLLEAAAGQGVVSLTGHTGEVAAVAFGPGGKRLASASRDGTLKVREALADRESQTFRLESGPLNAMAFSADAHFLAGASGKAHEPNPVALWDAGTGERRADLQGHDGRVGAVAFRPDGSRLASAGGEAKKANAIKVWDVAAGQELLTFTAHEDAINDVAFNPDGSRLASAADDGTVAVWDAETGKNLLRLKGGEERASAVCFSPDGLRLAGGVGSPEKTAGVKIWDAATGEQRLYLKGGSSEVGTICFSRDGKFLAADLKDGTVKVWDAATGAEAAEFERYSGEVLALCFSPDGKHLVGGTSDGTVKVWEMPSAQGTITPEDPSLEARRTIRWHQTQAQEAEDADAAKEPWKWHAAVFHRRALAALQPEQAESLARLGAARMEFGQQLQAAADFAAALKRDPHDSFALRWQARLFLEAGDRDGYRRSCAALVKAHDQTKDPELAQAVVETCTLQEGAVPDLAAILRLAREAAAARKDDFSAHSALAVALLRAGRHREAAERLQKARELRSQDQPRREELLLAIAQHHLGQAADARRSLDAAVAWLDREQSPLRASLLAGVGAAGPLGLLPALRGQDYDPLLPRLGWATCLELRLLRREAEELIGRQP
jgi:WD40 repeat protein